MRLRAIVTEVTGRTTHLRGVRVFGELEVVVVADANTIEITVQDGAVYLLRFDRDGACIADTWHETVEAAKEQAKLEFAVDDSDWQNLEPHH